MSATATAVEKRWRVRPRQEWVLIRKIVRGEEITEGGVIKPGAQDERSQRGVIVAVSGMGGTTADLKPGDTVVFTNYAIDIPDLEELTGERNICLVRGEEVYAVAEEIE